MTESDGSYQLPALPPGTYTVAYQLQGMQTVTRQVTVNLNQITMADATLNIGGVAESVQVTATTTYVDRTSAALTSGLSSAELDKLPTGTQYRDLVNNIPGVQYTQQQVRGPSAGASGQSNVYNFDGVNVTTPLFGTLAAEPSAQDVAEYTVVKGGATAMDFNRAGGFSINTISKSGTSQFHGEASYRFQEVSMSAAQDNGSLSAFDENRAFTNANIGGPIVKDKAFFYGSYYRPTVNRDNSATAYGPVPNLEDTRNEGFGKVTLTPTHSTLFNVSYRSGHELEKASGGFSAFQAGTSGSGSEAWQRIGTADGSWIINNSNVATFKYTHFANPTQGIPDNVSPAIINTAIGTHLPINDLTTQGLFTVPKPIAGNSAQNAFVQPIINQYGYVQNGVPQGGGIVGVASLLTDQDNFFRNAGQFGYNTDVCHRQRPPQPARRLSAVRRLRGSEAHVERLGIDQRTGRDDQVPGRDSDLLPDDLPGARHGPGADDPLGVPLAQLRGERHHQLEQLDDQRRPGRQPRHALRAGLDARCVGAVRLRQVDRDDTRGAAVPRSTRSRSAR